MASYLAVPPFDGPSDATDRGDRTPPHGPSPPHIRAILTSPRCLRWEQDGSNEPFSQDMPRLEASDIPKRFTREQLLTMRPEQWITAVGPWTNEGQAKTALKLHIEYVAKHTNTPVTKVVTKWASVISMFKSVRQGEMERNELCRPNVDAMESIAEELRHTETSTGILKLSGLDGETAGYLLNETSSDVSSEYFNAVVRLNGKPFGSPDAGSLETGKLPDSPNSLAFLMSFTLPENARSTVDCQIVIRSTHRADSMRFGTPRIDPSLAGTPTLATVGTMRLSLKTARAHAPIWKNLTPKESAALFGVNKSARMWQLTFTGRPSLHIHNDYLIGDASDPRRAELERAQELFRQDADVVVDFFTPQFEQDSLIVLQEFVDAAWAREGGNSLAAYTTASKYKHVLNQGTIAPIDAMPMEDKVPATIVFDDSLQHKIALAYSIRGERQYQLDQLADLSDAVGITAKFMHDPAYIHPDCGTPQVYLAFVRVPESLLTIAPKIGQAGQIILPTVTRIPYELSAEQTSTSTLSREQQVTHVLINAFEKSRIDNLTGECLQSFWNAHMARLSNSDGGSQPWNDQTIVSIQTICDENEEDEDIEAALLVFVKTQTWMQPPAAQPASVLEEPEAVTMSFTRVKDAGSMGDLVPSNVAVYRVVAPVDVDTGKLRWPQKLSIPDIFRDQDGNVLSERKFQMQMFHGPDIAISVKITDSDKTYRAEFNALCALSQPFTVSERDRPSEISCELYDQIWSNSFKDYLPMNSYFPILEDILSDDRSLSKPLTETFRKLSKDKREALRAMLNDKKKVKLIEGPPGTGKSHFAAALALAMLLESKTSDEFDEKTKPAPGQKLSDNQFEERMEKLALNIDPGAVPVSKTRQVDSELPDNGAPNVRIMYIVDQNKPVNDMVDTFKKVAKEMGIKKVNNQPLVIVRVHSTKAESRDLPNKYLSLARDLRRVDPSSGGLSQAILGMIVPITGNVDASYVKHRSERRVDVSLAELACQKYEQNTASYVALSHLINEVKLDPELWRDKRASILRLVQSGPMTDAMNEAHVVLTTLVISADFWLRKFEFGAIFLDEAARAKEPTSLIPFAYYSPRVYILLGDRKQNPPVVFSEHQDAPVRAKTDFGGSLLGLDFADRQAAKEAVRDARDKAGDPTKADEATTVEDTAAVAPAVEVSQLPEHNRRPNTFINQLRMSLFTRLASGGSCPLVMLTTNHRTEGPCGEIFNQLFYNGQLRFRKTTRTKNPQYEAMTDFLWWVGHEFEQRMTPALGGDGEAIIDVATGKHKMIPVVLDEDTRFSGNTILVNMSSKEGAYGSSYRNDAHAAYAQQKIIDFFGTYRDSSGHDTRFDGSVLYASCYAGQVELVQWLVDQFGQYEITSWGECVKVDKSRIHVRTHLGAQGFV